MRRIDQRIETEGRECIFHHVVHYALDVVDVAVNDDNCEGKCNQEEYE